MQAAARRLAVSSSSPVSSSSSSSSSKRVFIGLLQSNFSGRGKSFAASVTSSPCKPQKHKRIHIEERRALVESCVDKYKARNGGKFPSVSQVQQETGGSYYIIRQLVQELEYKTKFASLNKGSENLSKADTNQNSVVKEMPSTSVRDETLKSNIGIKDEPSVSLNLESEAHTSEFPSEATVGCKTDIGMTHSSHDAPRGKVVEDIGDKALESEEHPVDHQRSFQQEDAQRTTNLWGNLRSLADGIIGIWRKSRS
ncbi:hypothetical protein Cni_G07497 [Canna indica]|uniref:AT3G52170-like helix-turn-helix domain-containing protein n=1 Tax=Canna indica TaxID=4628 RepID=A0AAQ3Q6X7_9LILI|nr:hypothetical protein Cni_G07497 [Canna indica]